jgi:8-oxo-dGTP pyrophosphatase MutT (NUDIX family)
MSPPDFHWPSPLPEFPGGSLPKRMSSLRSADESWQVEGRTAAVLLLFLPPSDGTQARLLFMRRSTKVRSHKGQIGLPGGRREAGDESPKSTALREFSEELGVSSESVQVVGSLPPITALDGSPIVTVIGLAAFRMEDFTLAADEVSYVFADPWTHYAAGCSKEFQFNIFGSWRRSRLFDHGQEPIWGLTAQILDAANFQS